MLIAGYKLKEKETAGSRQQTSQSTKAFQSDVRHGKKNVKRVSDSTK